MRLFIVISLIFIFPIEIWAFKVPSSVAVAQSFDNDSNRSTNVNLALSTKAGAILVFDYTNSYFEFDDDEKGNFSTVGLGIGTNPLNDWVFNVDFSYSVVSDQMAVSDPNISLKRFFGSWDAQLTVGYRIIEVDITDQIRNLFSIDTRQITDENYWWSLSLGKSFGDLYVFAKYSQYQYTRSLGFFNRNIATTLGYDLDTISFGTSLIDFIAKVGLSYNRKRWTYSIDYSRAESEFEEGSLRVLSPSVAFQLNKKWAFDLNLGFTRGVAEDEEDTLGRFLGLGTTFFW